MFVPAVADMPAAALVKGSRRQRLSSAASIELEIDGVTVRVGPGAQASTVATVIRAAPAWCWSRSAWRATRSAPLRPPRMLFRNLGGICQRGWRGCQLLSAKVGGAGHWFLHSRQRRPAALRDKAASVPSFNLAQGRELNGMSWIALEL